MKKKFVLPMIIAILLVVIFTACKTGEKLESAPTIEVTTNEGKKELPMVTVLVDLNQSDLSTSAVSDLLSSTPGYGTEFMLLTDTMPTIWDQDTQVRDAALTRVKTEILAGKGPDVFLLESPATYSGNKGSSVFPFPKKAMDNHLLLPLDEYIEKSGRIEWDKLVPKVMEAGRNDEGQQILPMTFGFDVIGFNKEQFTLDAELPMTCDEMLESSDRMVQYAGISRSTFRNVFGQIEDNKNDTMFISEENIISRYEQFREVASQADFPEFSVEDPLNDRGTAARYNLGGHGSMFMEGGNDYWLLPHYNTEGGITATVNSFAAINRNTKSPDLSFRVLETIFSASGQRSDLFTQLDGQPVHMDVSCPGWSASQWNDQQYAALLEQINATVFRTPVEQEFDKLLQNISAAGVGADLAALVHEHYVTMQMMLAES